MSIKSFLQLVFFLGVSLSVYLTYKFLNQKSGINITNFKIIEYRCSSAIRNSSKVDVFYNGKKYSSLVSDKLCFDLKDFIVEPDLNYIENEDKIVFNNQNYLKVYMILAYVFTFILPTIGFYIYRHELNNSYKTM